MYSWLSNQVPAPPPPPPPDDVAGGGTAPVIDVTSIELNPADECAFEVGHGADGSNLSTDGVKLGCMMIWDYNGLYTTITIYIYLSNMVKW